MFIKNFQLTFGLIKPHVIQNPVILSKLQTQIVENNFFIIRSKYFFVTADIAERFYEEHQNKFFYQRLVSLMRSGPSQALILGRENAISEWRRILGPTKVFKTIFSHPESLRGQFGLTDTRNAVHGADSAESVKRECQIVFPEFDLEHFEKHEQQFFEANKNIQFDEENFVHNYIKPSDFVFKLMEYLNNMMTYPSVVL